ARTQSADGHEPVVEGLDRRRSLAEHLLPRDSNVGGRRQPLSGAARHLRRRLRPAVRFSSHAGEGSAADRKAARRHADRAEEAVRGGRPRRRPWGTTLMAKLKSELEVTCPCCQAILIVDTNLGRVVSHREPDRGNKPELSDAQRILAREAERRESIFQQSVETEKGRGDALSKRFDEALRQAKEEPVTKPMRDFDLD